MRKNTHLESFVKTGKKDFSARRELPNDHSASLIRKPQAVLAIAQSRRQSQKGTGSVASLNVALRKRVMATVPVPLCVSGSGDKSVKNLAGAIDSRRLIG